MSHYENNYGGAIRRLNLIDDQLAELDYTKTAGFLLNGFKKAGAPVESLLSSMIPTFAVCCCAGIILYLVGSV
jgi:hypothetical protein